VLSLVANLADTPAELEESFTRECRKNVRHARRAGATFEPIEQRATWLACDALNRSTFRDEPMEAYSTECLELLWDRFVARGLGRVFGVRYDGELVSVLLAVGTDTSWYGWIGFNRRPPPLRGANNLLTAETMKCARARGVRYYEFGTLEFDDPRQRAIADYKRGFGAGVRPAMGGRLVLSEIKSSAATLASALVRKLRDIQKR